MTALDLPPVLPRFLENAEARGLRARVETLEGDYHQSELPLVRYDRIVLANVLHLENRDAAAIARRFRPALAVQGQMVIIDTIAAEGAETSPEMAASTLSLGLRMGTGRPYTEATLREWLSAAGLTVQRCVDPEDPPQMVTALVGSSPD